MSITDELREYANGWSETRRGCYKRLIAIADRIDEWNKADVRCEYTRGYTAGFDAASGEVETADELRERMEREYIKAPVDADGVPIRVGDYVETLIEAFKGQRGRVEYLALTEDGWEVDGEAPSTVRHIKPDSWERIIKDAVKLGYADYPTTSYEAELVGRCRRLAGE